ncbi:unnamed protein product, partial [Amoebophrya sp. A25]
EKLEERRKRRSRRKGVHLEKERKRDDEVATFVVLPCGHFLCRRCRTRCASNRDDDIAVEA